MGSVESSFAQLFSQNPFAGYTLIDWLKLTGVVAGGLVWLYGVWSAYRYSKGQISKRFLQYLDAHEENILAARKSLLRRLAYGETVRDLVANKALEQAFNLLKSARVLETSAHLGAFQRLLSKRAQFGERHRDLANRQAATVLLFMGILAIRQNQTLEARKHFEHALDLSKSDGEVQKYLGQLDFELGNPTRALSRYEAALNGAGNDIELKASVWNRRAQLYNSTANPQLEKNDLTLCAPILLQLRQWETAGQCYERLAELQEVYGPRRQALPSYKRAHWCYTLASNRAKLVELAPKIGLAPAASQSLGVSAADLWQWLRLTAEIAILLSGLFMLVSRT